MDAMVLATQQWLNATYSTNPGYNPVTEDGVTGWGSIHSLTRALQIELGISPTSDTFGPDTQAAAPTISSGATGNIVKILQGSMYCKGYDGSALSGTFDSRTTAGIIKLQTDTGLPNVDGVVIPVIWKGLMSMDAYVLVHGGDPTIRLIQQALNTKYYTIAGLGPCDGYFSRNMNKALIYGVQIEEGLSGPTGSWTTYTGSTWPTIALNDSRTRYVQLVQYSLYVNGYDPLSFDGVYNTSVQNAVTSFQAFMMLPQTGITNMATMKQLLTSSGDTSRTSIVGDCATILNSTNVQSLVASGIQYIGRYLTGFIGGNIPKSLTRGELSAIFNAGLSVFPIFEDGGYSLPYFTYGQGYADAVKGVTAAQNLGVPKGTILYYTVDFDALDTDIDTNVLPYFEGVYSYFSSSANTQGYQIGVYGARNVCTRISNGGFAVSSFVSGMSTGFSGNMGFTMPTNWALNQYVTVNAGNDTVGYVAIDRDDFSGRDKGFNHMTAPTTASTGNRKITSVQYTNGIGQAINIGSTSGDLYRLIDPMLNLSGQKATHQYTRAYLQNGQTYAGNTVFEAQDLTLNFMVQFKNAQPVAVTNDTQVCNFVGKVNGSNTANSNFAKAYSFSGSIPTPSQFVAEFDQPKYTAMSAMGSPYATQTVANSYILFQLFAFDVVGFLTKKYGESIWNGISDVARKAQLAQSYVQTMKFNWTGFGTCPTGNGESIAAWYEPLQQWYSQQNGTSGTPTTLSINTASTYVCSDGYAYFTAFAPTQANGTTANTINTDYAELQVTSNFTVNADPRELVANVFNPANASDGDWYTRSTLAVTLSDGSTYYRDCTVQEAPTFPQGYQNKNDIWQSVQVLLSADDPFWYVPMTQTFTNSTSGGVQSIFVNNGGEVPTGVKVRMNAPLGGENRTGLYVLNTTTGDKVKQAANSYTTDVWVELNTETGYKWWYVGKSSWSSRFQDLDPTSVFFKLATGNNALQIGLTTGFLGDGYVYWKEKHTSIN